MLVLLSISYEKCLKSLASPNSRNSPAKRQPNKLDTKFRAVTSFDWVHEAN